VSSFRLEILSSGGASIFSSAALVLGIVFEFGPPLLFWAALLFAAARLAPISSDPRRAPRGPRNHFSWAPTLKTKGRRQLPTAFSFGLQLTLALDEAFLDHLLIAEPQIGDVG
jgi:hypothetical protein